MGEAYNLLTYECLTNATLYEPGTCSFNRDPKNILISEGDIITIRTDVSDIFTDRFTSPATYFVTILLELDPL